MANWLVKSEPGTWSWDDHVKAGVAEWDGVRNYQACNNMKAMKIGDKAFFYHSACKVPAAVGIMRIASEPYPDPTQFDKGNPHYDAKSDPDDPTWLLVDVKFVRKFRNPVTLEAIRKESALADMRRNLAENEPLKA